MQTGAQDWDLRITFSQDSASPPPQKTRGLPITVVKVTLKCPQRRTFSSLNSLLGPLTHQGADLGFGASLLPKVLGTHQPAIGTELGAFVLARGTHTAHQEIRTLGCIYFNCYLLATMRGVGSPMAVVTECLLYKTNVNSHFK